MIHQFSSAVSWLKIDERLSRQFLQSYLVGLRQLMFHRTSQDQAVTANNLTRKIRMRFFNGQNDEFDLPRTNFLDQMAGASLAEPDFYVRVLVMKSFQ